MSPPRPGESTCLKKNMELGGGQQDLPPRYPVKSCINESGTVLARVQKNDGAPGQPKYRLSDT